jgi:hypothetical protein
MLRPLGGREATAASVPYAPKAAGDALDEERVAEWVAIGR